MTILTDGIVIREQNTGEQDKLVTILTRKKGVIKAFVNGGRNPKNKNVSSTGLLCYSDLSIEKTKKEVYIIKESTSKNVFFSLREDIIILSLAQYLAELTSELAPREEEAGEFLSLILNSLHFLSLKQKPSDLVKAVTELRMLSLAGFMPSLIGCGVCGEFLSDTMYFSERSGELFCGKCTPSDRLTPLSAGIVTAMRHICLSDSKKIFAFSLPQAQLLTLNEVSESYLKAVTARKYNTLEFYKKMTRL